MHDIIKSPLLLCNELEPNNSGIWVSANGCAFGYSDGEASEKYLRDLILGTDDLTSISPELEKKVIDWVSEYHLSPERANILRALNLDGVSVAMELGCGCGAITRYLGELNIKVDAVEGNIKRAEIAKLRCRDLSGITVTSANFNDLIFPDNTYGAVFLIGVLEYAKRFCKTAVSETDAVAKILTKVKPALAQHGAIIIAIENRMGLKYWMGASEDHYAQPFIGLYGYPYGKDIATYDRKQWINILKHVGFKQYSFVYPFPDYKLAKVILSQSYLQNDAFAHSPLYRISSRDYEKIWKPNIEEFLLWRSLHQNGYLEEFANSFIIIITDSADRLQELVPVDFMHFSDYRRKASYRTVTLKPKNELCVLKKQLWSDRKINSAHLVKQNLKQAEYIRGPLLSSIWLDNLLGNENIAPFETQINTYYDFLIRSFNQGASKQSTLDLLPFNIIVDDEGKYRTIDKEWETSIFLTPEYILFRALLLLSFYHRKLIERICKKCQLYNVKEFITYFFSILSIPIEDQIDRFIKTEEEIQREIVSKIGAGDIKNYLSEPFEHVKEYEKSNEDSVQLFWAQAGEAFCEEKSLIVQAVSGNQSQTIEFKIPSSPRNIHRLRLDPMSRIGLFNISRFTIKRYQSTNCMGFCNISNFMIRRRSLRESEAEEVWNLCSAEEIAIHSLKKDVSVHGKNSGAVFISTSNDPQMIFELPDFIKSGRKRCEIKIEAEMSWKR